MRKLLLISLALLISACGESTVSGSGSAPADPPAAVAPAKTSATLAEFMDALTAAGMTVGDKSEKMYGMIGARDGFSVKVNEDWIQAYEYEPDLKSATDMMQKLVDEGMMGRRAVAHKNLLMMVDEKHPDWAQVLEIFNSL